MKNTIEKELIKNYGERMVNKYRCYLIYKDSCKDNKRMCPFYSEFYGMVEALSILGIPMENIFDDDYELTGFEIAGQTFTI